MADATPAPDLGITIGAPDTKGAKLTPVAGDPFAKGAKGAKLTPVDHDPFAGEATVSAEPKYYETEKYKKGTSSFEKGRDVGFDSFGIGSAQLFSEIGTKEHNLGQIMPVFKDGKLTFGYPPQRELAQKAKDIDKRSEQLDTVGSVGKFLMDPTLLVGGEGKLSMILAKQAATSSLFAPTTKAEQSLGGRATTAGISGALAYGMGEGMTAAAPYVKKAASYVGQKLYDAVNKLGPNAGALIKQAGEKISQGFSKPTGDMTEPSTLHSLANKLGITFTGKEKAAEVWEKISTAIKNKTEDLANSASEGASSSEPWGIGHNVAISKEYGKALDANSQLYKKATDLGAKEHVVVTDLDSHLKDVIEHLGKQVAAGEGSINPKLISTLNTLKEIQTGIAEGGVEAGKRSAWENAQRVFGGGEIKPATITGDKLVALDKALNENFGRTGFSGNGGKALANLQNEVQKMIKGMSPEFSQAYEKAKTDYIANIIHKYRENPYLKNIWNEDDFRAIQDMQRGIPLSPEIAKRTEKMISSIKTYNDLAKIKEVSPESYDAIRGVVFLNKMKEAGINPAKLEDKETYALLLKSLEHDPQAVAALDAMKSFMEEMNRAGISKKPTPIELEEVEERKERAARTIFSYATGHVLYAIKHAIEWATDKAPSTAAGRLTGLAGKVAEGAPKAVTKMGVVPQAAGKAAASATGEFLQK